MAELWNTIILEPVLNSLIAMCTVLGGNFGLAIIVLTVVVRLALFPLTVRQTQSTKAMQSLQPRIQELQKKYAKNQQKLQQEMMKVYKEAGINPLGCLWPMLIQLPIWIALYQSIMQALAATPESLLKLSQHLYHWAAVGQAVPLNEHFLAQAVIVLYDFCLGHWQGIVLGFLRKFHQFITYSTATGKVSNSTLASFTPGMLFAILIISFSACRVPVAKVPMVV